MAARKDDVLTGPAALAVSESEPEGRTASGGRERDLFSDLVASNATRRRRGFALPISLAAHAAGIALLVVASILWSAPPPRHPDYVRALLYDPPPPPPPPLPRGSDWVQRSRPTKPAEPRRRPAALVPPEEQPQVEAPRSVQDANQDVKAAKDEPAGSPTGSELGTPEGMEGGVEGGVVGGIPGGVLGGVVGGTGDIPLRDLPVRDPDRPPRLIQQTKPVYPREAFVKKVEGTVLVELLIDATGRVARARVIRSVPLLDAAALEAVRQWVFSPAIKRGQPVATEALAPVTFRLY